MIDNNESTNYSTVAARIAALKHRGIDNNHGASLETGNRKTPLPLPNQRPALPIRQYKSMNNVSNSSPYFSVIKQNLGGEPCAKVKALLPPSVVERSQSRDLLSAKISQSTSKEPPALPARKISDKIFKNVSATELFPPSNEACQSRGPCFVGSPENQSPGQKEIYEYSSPSASCRDTEVIAKKSSNSTIIIQTSHLPSAGLNSASKKCQKPDLPPRPPEKRNKELTPIEPSKNQCVVKTVSALSLGFQNESAHKKYQKVRSNTNICSAVIQELVTANFDSITRGILSLIMLYNRYDWNCQKLKLDWSQLAESFSFASDRLLFGQVDIASNPELEKRFKAYKYPAMVFLAIGGVSSEQFIIDKSTNLEAMTLFVESKSGLKSLSPAFLPFSPAPPINLRSKPSIRDIENYQARTSRTDECLRCKDFSRPDEVSLKYPRHSLPHNQDVTSYLAHVLCGPFQSSTDKARAIFTWLHHNIAYDVEALFGNRLRQVKPEETIASGLAVCAGYAGLFEAIAKKAGLKAVTITGHGKGLGYKPMKHGDPIPSYNPNGHAWNAVYIDYGEWKLIDSCWGAGTVNGHTYSKRFSPREFSRSNEEFGICHFPQDTGQFYRSDGMIPSWEQYMRGLGPTDQEPVQEFGNVDDEYGISLASFSPPQKYISLSSYSTTIRFQFFNVCKHFDYEKKWKCKPFLFVLCLHGSKDEWLPFDSNGYCYSIDVPIQSMTSCKKVGSYVVTQVDGKDARGMAKDEFIQKKGSCAMNFSGVSSWEVV